MSWFPQVGDTVGRYRITDVLGQGGMGVVFVAVAPDLERPVALKVLAPQAAVDPRLRERFAREAATLARLDSPHIVYILEYGEQDGCPYLVTQLVPDGDLRQHLDERGPLSPRQAADVMEQVAAGLEEAHSHGVVHRDLKSANVLLRRLPRRRAPRLSLRLRHRARRQLRDDVRERGGRHPRVPRPGAAVRGAGQLRHGRLLARLPAVGRRDGCAAVPGQRGRRRPGAPARARSPASGRRPGEPRHERDRGPRDGQEARRPLRVRPRDAAGAGVAEGAGHRAGGPVRLVLIARVRSDAVRRRSPWRAWPLAAIVLAAAVWLVRDPSEAPASQRDDGTPHATASPSTASQRRCWDGRVGVPADCSAPSGVQGLQWVYPAFKQARADCRRVARPLSPRKVARLLLSLQRRQPERGHPVQRVGLGSIGPRGHRP